MSSLPTSAHSILIVDDSKEIVALLKVMLATEGYRVKDASDGLKAMESIGKDLPDLILLDLDMPRMNGFEVCKQLKADPRSRLIPIVILTGRGDSDLRPRVWDLGADEILTKPFQTVEVLSRCRSLLRVKNLVDDLDSAHSVVFAMARAIEAKSRYTQGHTERVTEYALALARRIGVPETEHVILRYGGALHDLGKIAIPDEILNKPARLTTEEYEIVKQHPIVGAHIAEPLRSVRDAVPLIRWHHERMDGRGYPDGLPADRIPLLVRVLAVADVFDALSSARPYRGALPISDCLSTLRSDAAGGGLDRELVEVFCSEPAIPYTSCREPENPAVQTMLANCRLLESQTA